VKRPDPKIFRALGYVSIGAAVLLLALFLANLRSRIHYGGPNLAPLGWMALYAAIVGWGLVSLRRWSVVLLAIPTLATGLFLVIGSVLEVPFPWSLIKIAMGVALCAPALLASLCWRGLR
jgi:hypothetical protein